MYLLNFVITGADEDFNGERCSRFTANSQDELKEQIQGIVDTFYENFPAKDFPDATIRIIDVFQEIPIPEGINTERNISKAEADMMQALKDLSSLF